MEVLQVWELKRFLLHLWRVDYQKYGAFVHETPSSELLKESCGIGQRLLDLSFPCLWAKFKAKFKKKLEAKTSWLNFSRDVDAKYCSLPCDVTFCWHPVTKPSDIKSLQVQAPQIYWSSAAQRCPKSPDKRASVRNGKISSRELQRPCCSWDCQKPKRRLGLYLPMAAYRFAAMISPMESKQSKAS